MRRFTIVWSNKPLLDGIQSKRKTTQKRETRFKNKVRFHEQQQQQQYKWLLQQQQQDQEQQKQRLQQ